MDPGRKYPQDINYFLPPSQIKDKFELLAEHRWFFPPGTWINILDKVKYDEIVLLFAKVAA